jgi:autotransporter translocation and assembly factor TamB
MKRKNKILIISGIIIFLLALGGYFSLQSSFLLNKIRGIVETQLTNELKTDIKLGRLSGNLLYGVKIEDVIIADKKEPGQTIISMEAFIVKYDLLKLLSSTIAVKELILQKPVIHAMVDEKGNINLVDLISTATTPESKEKKSPLPPFGKQAQEVKLVDGEIYYQDKLHNIDATISGLSLNVSGPLSPWNHEGKLAFRDATIEVNDVKKHIGTFDVAFHFTEENGQLERLRLEMEDSWLEARADTNFKSPMLRANVNGEINLKDIASFLPSVERLEGIARLNVSASGPWDAIGGHLELTAPTVLFNPTFSFKKKSNVIARNEVTKQSIKRNAKELLYSRDLSVSDVSVNADFTNNSVKVTQFSVNIADGNVLATAQAQIKDGIADYDVQVSITSVPLGEGPVAELLLSMLTSAQKDEEWQEGKKARRQEANILPTLTGKIQGKIKLSGRGTDWSRLDTEGQFELSDGTLNSVKLLPTIINYTLRNEQLTVNADIDKIRAEISGRLGLTDKTDLKINVTSIDLNRLAEFASPVLEQPPAPFGKGEIAGTGALQAEITGELTNPKVLANLTLQDIAMNGTRLGNAMGQFRYSENHVQIDELQLRNVDTQCVVRGRMTLSDNPTVDLKVALNPLQISEYTTLLMGSGLPPDKVGMKGSKPGTTPINLQGRILGEIAVSGPITALNGGGEFVTEEMFVSLPDVSDSQQPFSVPPSYPPCGVKLPIEMTIPLKLKNGILQIPELTLKTTGGEFNVSAVYNPDGKYEFQLNSEDLDLVSILNVFGIGQLKGYARLSADGKGTVKNPKASIQLDLKSIQYGDIKIGDVACNGYFDNNKIQFNAAALADTFKLEGEIDAIQPMPFNVTVQLENLDFGALLPFADKNSFQIGGETTGVFKMDGEIASIMNSRGTIQLQSVAIETPRHRFFNIKPIEIEFANLLFLPPLEGQGWVGEQGVLHIKQFELFQKTVDKPALAMRGQISQQKSDFTLQSDAFDLSILNDFITNYQSPITNTSGVGKFNLHLIGSYLNPEFTVDWEFPEILIATKEARGQEGKRAREQNENSPFAILPLSHLAPLPINSSGHIIYRDKLLTIDQIQFALYSNPLMLKGEVPIDLTPTRFQSPGLQLFSDSPMRVQLTASNWNVKFIEQFIPNVIEKISGHANMNMEISGSPINPQVSGNILLSDLCLQSPVIPQPLENLSAAINVNIDMSKVNALNQANAPWLACTLDSLRWNIGRGRYAASGSLYYRLNTPSSKEITSWFNADGLNAIKDSIARPEVELTFQGDDIDLVALVMSSQNDTKATKLPFDGRASIVANVKGTGMKPQDYTAQVEIEPLVLMVGDYNLRNSEKISITLQNGQLQLDSILLESQFRGAEKAEPTAKISLGGSANLDGHFNLKMLIQQFNLKMFASLTDAFGLRLSPFLTNVPPIDGLVSIQLDANGTPVEPEAFARFEIQNIHVQNITVVPKGINVDSIEGSIALKNGTLTVNPISLKTYNNELTFHGTIPLGIQNSPEPMEIFIKGENINLEPFAGLSPLVEEISGIANIDMVLRDHRKAEGGPHPLSPSPLSGEGRGGRGLGGEVVNPYLTGTLMMTDGRIKLVNLDTPIEKLKLSVTCDCMQHEDRLPTPTPPEERTGVSHVAQQMEHPDKIGYDLSFQLSSGKCTMAGQISMDKLMPKQYDGTLDIEKFPLDIIAKNFLKGEIANNLSGYLSANVETKVNVEDLLTHPYPSRGGDISQTLQPSDEVGTGEQKFWKMMGAAMGSKVTLSEINIQLAGYPIYNPEPISIILDGGILSLPGCKLDYQKTSRKNPIFLRAYGRWELNNPPTPFGKGDNQLAFELRGAVDTKMIADFTQLSTSLSELANSIDEPLISGLIEYSVSLRGSASEPQITVRWPAANLGLLGSDMELIDGEISFEPKAECGFPPLGGQEGGFGERSEQGLFNIKNIELVTEKTDIGNIKNINTINIAGQVPFNLSFMPPVFSPSQNELDLKVSISIDRLDSLPLLAIQNATIDGNGKINIKVRGPIQSPQFSGDVILKDIVYQYENVNLTDTNVKITLDSNSITIEQARGMFNNGVYQASGTIGLSGYKLTDLNISGSWSDVLWEQEGFVSATSEGSVRLLGTFDKPRLEGNVIVNNGSFSQSWQDIAKGIISGQPKGRSEVILDYPLVKDLELDLNVQIPQLPPDNYFWLDTVGTKIQPQVNGRVVGPLNPPERIIFTGQVNILDGEFSYFNRKFLIKNGTIENSSPYVLDPKYEIDAETATPIVGAKIPGAQEPKDVKVTLKLAGTLQSPQAPALEAEVIKPTPGEQYNFDQMQILSLLAFGNISGQAGGAVPSSTSETATNFLMRQAETFVGSQIASKLNLRELQLNMSDKEGSSPQFLITKDISSQWAVTYMSSYSLSAKPYMLGIEYKLNKNVSVAGTRNEYGKYGVDLKYGIEW